MKPYVTLLIVVPFLLAPPMGWGEELPPADLEKRVQDLQRELEAVKEHYEGEIRKLRDEYETRLSRLEALVEGREVKEEAPAKGEEADIEEILKEARVLAEGEKVGEKPVQAAPGEAQRLNVFNPRITVFGDLVGRADDADVFNDEGEEIGDRFSMREVELDFRADIDPFAKGVFIGSWEEESPGTYEATVEEGYLTFETLPWNLRAKAGRFRTSFGQINKLHTHDLPQTTTPIPVRNFLGEEGDIQNGLHISYLVPRSPFELELEVLNGENDAVLAGSESEDLAYLGHVRMFKNLSENAFLELGLSHLFGYNDPEGDFKSNLTGLDLLYKWRPLVRSEYRSFVLQAEAFLLNREMPQADIESFGAYAFAQYQFDRNWYAGTRFDYSQLPDSDLAHEWSLGGYLSYYTTEFLRLRLGYEHLERDFGTDEDTIYFQTTFVFGSHPVEPYWFNR